ncbi:hypothetical protein [Mariniflexile sp. AS56]|uniref:hypothetical protein n=1 Tax=Mariniflexile sp. AS56 TaxID=3063957 RepID=UPI0026EC5F9F|nr:hypothetical protein [Mariniflexile sp. AS56]MDO7171394.1 hypothetical protein [Mariniflexile sp. AS56]
MDSNQPKLKDLQSKYLPTDKKSLIIGSIIATILAITPYLFSLYESVPNEKVWNTFLFTYNSGFFENANTAMWIITGKAIPLLLILIWFFTNRHWWYHVLLVPIAMYIFQIVSVFYDDQFLDKFQLIYMLPIMAIVIPSIYLVRARIFNEINSANKSLEELEEEFKISPKNFWQKIKQYF